MIDSEAVEVSSVLSDPEAERAVLGAAIVDNRLFPEIEAQLRVDQFNEPPNRLIYTATLDLLAAGRPVDLVTIVGQLREQQQLEAVGGAGYVASLTDSVPRGVNVAAWVWSLKERSRRRRAVGIAERFVAQAASANVTTDELLDHFHGELGRLMDGGERKTVRLRDVMAEAVADLERFAVAKNGVVGVPTGLDELDSVLGGLVPGRLYVVAARTSRGKSVLCAQTAAAAAAAGHRVHVFSMEMKPYHFAQRMLLADAVVDRYSLRLGSSDSEYAWSKVMRSVTTVSPLPITFDPRESPTIGEVRTSARQEHARGALGLVVVDFLQRCTVDAKMLRDGNNWLGVGEIAKGLKSLAMSLDVPVLAACQLNADAEDKRPTLAMLGQAQGIISTEADAIVLLHPDDLARWKTQRFPVVNFLLDKNRHGPCLTIPFSFEKEVSRFVPVSAVPA